MSKARGHGEGSIYKRGAYTDKRGQLQPATWVISISLGSGAAGRRIRKRLYAPTEAEAKRRLRESIRQQHRGELVIGRHVTVCQHLEGWLQTRHDVADVKPSTYRHYKQAVNLHLIPSLGHVRLDELQPRHVQEMVNAAPRTRTVYHVLAVLHNALQKAVREGLLTKNVAEYVDLPRLDHQERRFLDGEEAAHFLASVRDNHDVLEPLYTLALLCGMREGELLGLRWGDIDLTAGTITIRKSLQRGWDGAFGLGDPKSQRSRRVLMLPGPATDALAAHRARLGEAVLPTAYVFSTATGKPLSPRNLVRSFKRALAVAGLPSAVRLHDLRHSHNALLDLLGVSARVRMDLLGHSDVRLTENTYNFSTTAQRREAADRIGRYIESRLATSLATSDESIGSR